MSSDLYTRLERITKRCGRCWVDKVVCNGNCVATCGCMYVSETNASSDIYTDLKRPTEKTHGQSRRCSTTGVVQQQHEGGACMSVSKMCLIRDIYTCNEDKCVKRDIFVSKETYLSRRRHKRQKHICLVACVHVSCDVGDTNMSLWTQICLF